MNFIAIRLLAVMVFLSSVFSVCATLDPVPLARLNRALEPLHKQFDPAENMLKRPFSSPGYHTTLTGGFVHPTRESLTYAVALLDTGDETLRARAEAILRRVIALQDQRTGSKTFGIWSWFLEEPLEKMDPPDFNWADFCGAQLLQVALDHRQRLPADVRQLVDDAIQRAAQAIRKRNVGPDYTNIAIMGSYVTLVAAELYGDADLRDYALARWRRFHDFTMRNGAFSEYNSPTYTIVALKELARMRLHVKDAEARTLTEAVYRVAWEEIAQHFHPPTRQWAGPHSRAYRTLLGNEVLALLQRATDGRVDFGLDQPALDERRAPAPCPRDLEPLFGRLDGPRDLRKTFVAGTPPVIGVTHLEPAFALGTINRGDLWNQRRALVAYWGTADKPACLHLRFLHDDYDYASAQFASAQRGGDVLGIVNFATDGGDRHPSLDKVKNATIRARDLRLRFEFGGSAGQSEGNVLRATNHSVSLKSGAVRVRATVPHAVFGELEPRYETGHGKDRQWFDVVLYAGAEREFDFNAMRHAAVAFGLEISTADSPFPAITANRSESQLALKWNDLALEASTRPAKASELRKHFKAEAR
jgi:hypothetical protein